MTRITVVAVRPFDPTKALAYAYNNKLQYNCTNEREIKKKGGRRQSLYKNKLAEPLVPALYSVYSWRWDAPQHFVSPPKNVGSQLKTAASSR